MTTKQIKLVMWLLDELRPIAKRLHTLAENDFNYGLTPRQETLEKNLIEKARKIAREHGLYAYHQGDPRGNSLYLTDTKSDGSNYSNGVSIY